MSAATDAMIATAKSSAVSQASTIVAQGKAQFLALFGSFVKKSDLILLEQLFDKALLAKVGQFSAKTAEQAQDFADQYDAHMESIETLGDDYEIVGKAKAGVLIRSWAHQIISGFFAVAGAVLQVGLGIVLPGVGSLIGAGLNAGLQHVVAYFNKEG